MPKDIIAGDFYWLSETVTEDDKKIVFFAVADCTGHGVPGAMVSIVCSTALNKAVNELRLTDPGKILEQATEIVIESFDRGNIDLNDGMDISLIALEENSDKSVTINFAGANNPLWFIRKSTGELEEAKGTKRPVGKYNSPHSFETTKLHFVQGDLLYLFSDGFADQFGGPKHKKFKYKTLANLFEDIQCLNPLKQTEKMVSVLKDWQGNNEQIDDVCIAVIRL